MLCVYFTLISSLSSLTYSAKPFDVWENPASLGKRYLFQEKMKFWDIFILVFPWGKRLKPASKDLSKDLLNSFHLRKLSAQRQWSLQWIHVKLLKSNNHGGISRSKDFFINRTNSSLSGNESIATIVNNSTTNGKFLNVFNNDIYFIGSVVHFLSTMMLSQKSILSPNQGSLVITSWSPISRYFWSSGSTGSQVIPAGEPGEVAAIEVGTRGLQGLEEQVACHDF